MLDQLINGLVVGNLYALTAVGITQIYGVANVINFAHGSIYMVGAFVGWMAVTWFGLPLLPTLGLVLAASALLGLLVERVAIRPYTGSGRTVLLLTTIAAGLILEQAAQLIWGPETKAFHAPIADVRFRVGGGFIGTLDLVILAVGLTTALVLWLFLKRSRLGWAVRATAQDREAALQMGVDVHQVSRISFAMAGALAGVSGLLVGLYYHSVYHTMGFSASLKGFTAALLGGLGNIPGAILGAYLLGTAESLAVAWLGSTWRDLVGIALLLGVLLFRPGGLFAATRALLPEPTVGTFIPIGRPLRSPRWALLAAAAAALVLPLVVRNGYWLQVLATAWIFGLLAISLNLITGTAGQISLGHAGFLALGAYASAILTTRLQLPFLLALVVSPLIAAAIGVVICYPALRLRGQYLAVATIGLGQGIALVALNWTSLTRGALGISNIAPPTLFGVEIASAAGFYWLTLLLLIGGVWVAERLSGSYLGRAFRAVREDEVAARAYGVGLERYKSIAFGLSAFIAAFAGVLLAHSYTYIAPDTFTHALSLQVLTMVVLGGLDSTMGAVVGALALIAIPESARFLAEYRFLVYGLLLLAMLRFRPRGLLSAAS
ncbi:MAG: ABC transporter permease [Symbiobacterium sp.]|uniref:ABC transporter permease n=1 Tax=Symbiobacterium sp. TaxID=1971213 RepID=UPI0034642006